MPVALSLVQVSKSFGARPILQELSFALNQGEKVGLIGRNGAGKTTLFKLLNNEESPDSGSVILTQGLRVARLSQEPRFPAGASLGQVLEEALFDHRDLLLRYQQLHDDLAHVQGSEAERLHQELDEVEHKLQDWGWDLEPRIREALTQWNLPSAETPVDSLSGGWKKRVALAQTWLRRPDVLVLDEPTNHLDPEMVDRLQNWLQSFPGALLLITHDRHLLDAVVERMVELEHGRLTSYEGNYGDYLLERAERDFQQSKLTDRMENRLRRELAWLRRGPKARTSKSKIRIQDALDLKEEVRNRKPAQKTASIVFDGSKLGANLLLRADNLQFSYFKNEELIGGLDLLLQPGMRIALLGPNGCGKSTLLGLLTGEREPSSGSLWIRPRLRVSALSQERWELEGGRSIADNLAEGATAVRYRGLEVPVVAYLGRFGFAPEQQARPAESLSGGERNRFLLAKTMLHPADLLVLDEPTNDLDIPTLQNLEEALVEFPGSLLLVSHDRFFLDQVASHTLAWQPGKPCWEFYEGNPSTVRSLRAERKQLSSVEESPSPRNKVERTRAPKAGLSQKEQRRLTELENQMAELESEQARLEEALADPASFLTADSPGPRLLEDRTRVAQELETIMEEWMELEERKSALLPNEKEA